MALATNLLRLRYGDVSVSSGVFSLQWQVYHPSTSTIVETGWTTVQLAAPDRIPEAWDVAVQQANSAAGVVLSKHSPVAAIGNYSMFDSDLILDSWLSDPVAQTLVHPLSGSFSNVTYSGVVGLVNAILARVLGPPVWFWTESIAPLQLRVKCVAVTGATSYNIYDGTTFLGNVPNANWNTLTVPAGTYSVRVAAVKAGVVGIASFPTVVTVAETGGMAEMMPSGLGEPDASVVIDEPVKKTVWQRIAAWFRSAPEIEE